MRIDLHCHSRCSDGEVTATAVADRAREDGVELFCLTDHDTTAGYDDVCAAAGEMAVLRGVEISCQFEGRSIHLLTYEPLSGCNWAAIDVVLKEVAEQRRERLREMARRLALRGIDIDVESILTEAGTRVVGRPDMAKALLKAGAVRSHEEAFKTYLQDRGPLDVPSARLDLETALALTSAAGARTSIAHPHVYGEDVVRAICRAYAGQGLGGIEAYYGLYKSAKRKKWKALAREFSLVATGGSDMHRHRDTPRMGVEFEAGDADSLQRFLA